MGENGVLSVKQMVENGVLSVKQRYYYSTQLNVLGVENVMYCRNW
jgi:hypothetical protein